MYMVFVVILLTIASAQAQVATSVVPAVPIEMRRIVAVDVTDEVDPVYVGVGEGVVSRLPGPAFQDITNRNQSRVFNGVALLSPLVGLATALDGTVECFNPRTGESFFVDGIPNNCTSLVRCGKYAFGISGDALVRMQLNGSNTALIVDTVQMQNASNLFVTTGSHANCIVVNRITGFVASVHATSLRVTNFGLVQGPLTHVQGLTDALLAVVSRDTVDQVRIVSLDSTSRTITSVTTVFQQPTSLTARLAFFGSSRLGGGAVVIMGETEQGNVRRIFYSRSGVIDSTVQRASELPSTIAEIDAGVAIKYLINEDVRWIVSGPFIARGTMLHTGSIIPTQESLYFKRHLQAEAWMHASSPARELIVLYGVSKTPITNNSFFVAPIIAWSTDAANSWSTKTQTLYLTLMVADTTGTIYGCTDTSVVQQSIYSASTKVLRRLTSKPVAMLVNGETIVVCNDSVLTSTNAGESWEASLPDNYKTGLWIKTNDGTLLLDAGNRYTYSMDAGRTWTQHRRDSSLIVTSAVTLDANSVLLSCSNSLPSQNHLLVEGNVVATTSQEGYLVSLLPNYFLFGNRSTLYPVVTDPVGLGAVPYLTAHQTSNSVGAIPINGRYGTGYIVYGSRLLRIDHPSTTGVTQTSFTNGNAIPTTVLRQGQSIAIEADQVRITSLDGREFVLTGPRVVVSSYTLPNGLYHVSSTTHQGTMHQTVLVIP